MLVCYYEKYYGSMDICGMTEEHKDVRLYNKQF